MPAPQGIPAKQWSERLIDRLAYAHDASMYRLVPQAVVRPSNDAEVQSLLTHANDTKTPITFRTGGTSLSGQSITEGIIAEVVRGWQNYEVLDKGNAIKLEPGVIGARANIYLSAYQKRIGPDPASINAARIGGIISNNSSGMVCGVKNNAYHTMNSLRFMLANGHIYDTSNRGDYNRFIEKETDLSNGILACKKEIESQSKLVDKIRHKYRIKNTLGYSLNAFIDYDHPMNIFAHLIIGSEGTLAFFSEVVLKTIDDPPLKATGLALFDSVETAMAALPVLVDEGADAIEMLDDASLRTARYLENPPYDPNLIPDNSSALLFEFQKYHLNEIDHLTQTIPHALILAGGQLPLGMISDDGQRFKLWNIRKGLYPTVGSMRKKGTSVITEDLCYDYRDLPKVVNELKLICRHWQYDDAVIFGHAKDGNLHFAASMDLNSHDGAKRFEGLLDDMVKLTVGKFDGSLKAEHGTGRNMAPFVEYEWGGDLYRIMWRIKNLADPNSILNPNVLLTKDKKVHVKNLKKMPLVSDEVDLCVECGFCEPVCPSRELTMTPRQRIAVQREIAGGYADPSVMDEYRYDGVDTCAADGLCEIACPVNINTGSFVKSLRHESESKVGRIVSRWAANHFGFVQSLARIGLKIGHGSEKILGQPFLKLITRFLNKIGLTPQWNEKLPHAAAPLPVSKPNDGEQWLYFPTCLTRVFGSDGQKTSLGEVLMEISQQSGISIRIPPGINSTCCSQPFSSKGYQDAAISIQEKTINSLWNSSKNGEIPIVVDTSPCTYQFLHPNAGLSTEVQHKLKQLKIVDIIQFLDKCIGNPAWPKLKDDIALHPTCSTEKMGHSQAMKKLGEKCASNVTIPTHWGCCGFAGDRGLIVPELNQSATAPEVQDIKSHTRGFSTSRTCEVGMMSNSEVNYQSIAFLVKEYLDQSVN
ncbi:MAG: FAD-binding and (Fe-S)-binding domain-containing protein [Candidatus Marinimicrobia bacterium]|nr:FAD-binding and (Fe-S)-binding domain-containing protein [Candidatus Neomarinimicrobiota bacterium]